MKERIKQVEQEVLDYPINNKDELENYRIKFLGSKSIIKELFGSFKEVPNEQKKERIQREINGNLDFLIGSVTSQGPRGGFSLTTKEKGKSRTKYIRTNIVKEVRRLTQRHKKLKQLLQDLSEVNWELLKMINES